MSRRRGLGQLTLLTPVRPGAEQELAEVLAHLAAEGPPLGRLGCVHFARWVVLDELAARPPAARQPLRLQYLLFTATVDRSPDAFFAALCVDLGPFADDIWGHCVGYPGYRQPAEFVRYLRHNTVPVSQRSTAYDATVEQVGVALELRDQHIAFAVEAQQMDDEQLLSSFRERFRGGTP